MNVQGDLVARLSRALDGIAVSVTPSAPSPPEFVTVSRNGGGFENALIDVVGVDVYAWARSEGAAFSLMERVRRAMRSLPFSGGYASVLEESVRRDPDPLTKTPRWYASYTLKVFDENAGKEP
ncbi:MAG: hypothetical protein Q4B35_06440 [Slackia sp.]|nr:hypothetical protein [Slackia sp.]